ncbi:SipW-dependent-type signal peptide-containing protein [Agromyces larvae]|uniref:SipW-dependent-type signal peptide-containing protein n=1 Tax=Agromyces larvae TaxID=2929802 RepID=A0ABY4C0P4_9MICO|nr:SipW-dependent-type signal peptide-containing protein [Agromyces larvae]UOE44944.1 SipW-dependent-type signal peptide-containing protein [Agromyces larvae]
MPAHTRRPLRRGFQILIAACAALGIGAVATTAAWTDQAKFSAKSEVAAFDMQYSFTAAPDSWQTFKDTVTLDNWSGWIRRNEPKATHSVFIRNKASKTKVTIDPKLEGVFLDDAGFITIETGLNAQSPVMARWDGMTPVEIDLESWQEARIDLTFDPTELEPSEVNRVGSLTVTVTGTVGEAAPTGAPARGTSEHGIAAPAVLTPPRWEWT